MPQGKERSCVMRILIKNGRVIDPANRIDEERDILINNRIIEDSGKTIDENSADKIIDAKGK